jgi:hypothetical protein
MAATAFPTTSARRAAPAEYATLEAALRKTIRGDVCFDAGSRAV